MIIAAEIEYLVTHCPWTPIVKLRNRDEMFLDSRNQD
jgi:hypothetical protein